MARDPRLDSRAIDTDLHESLREHIGHLTPTELVVLQAPQITHTHDAAVVNADPRAVVKLMNRSRHG